jgi:hypothetical protein
MRHLESIRLKSYESYKLYKSRSLGPVRESIPARGYADTRPALRSTN